MWSRKVSAKEQAENIFADLRKNGRQKPFWTRIDRNQCLGRQYYLQEHHGVFNKTIILLRLAGYTCKMIITNYALRASLVIYSTCITSYPACPRRINIVN